MHSRGVHSERRSDYSLYMCVCFPWQGVETLGDMEGSGLLGPRRDMEGSGLLGPRRVEVPEVCSEVLIATSSHKQ